MQGWTLPSVKRTGAPLCWRVTRLRARSGARSLPTKPAGQHRRHPPRRPAPAARPTLSRSPLTPASPAPRPRRNQAGRGNLSLPPHPHWPCRYGSALPCYSDRDHPGARINQKSVQEVSRVRSLETNRLTPLFRRGDRRGAVRNSFHDPQGTVRPAGSAETSPLGWRLGRRPSRTGRRWSFGLEDVNSCGLPSSWTATKVNSASVTLIRAPWPWRNTQTSTSSVIEVRPSRLRSV